MCSGVRVSRQHSGRRFPLAEVGCQDPPLWSTDMRPTCTRGLLSVQMALRSSVGEELAGKKHSERYETELSFFGYHGTDAVCLKGTVL